tara:strand:+ start:57 stop:701 length:645 start_codon:yes stop_codon:yes gene_type:complete
MTDLIKRPIVQQAIQLFVQEPSITAQEVAKRLDVSAALIYNWKQNPNFVDAIYDRYMIEFGGELPAVLQSMIREAKAGNVQAARLVLEHSGKLVKNINITVDSPYEKFLKAEKAEIEYEDAEIEDIAESIPDIEVELPERKEEDQNKRSVDEKKNLKKAIKRGEANKKRTEWRKWKRRAKEVGLEPLPARRPTPAQKEQWINEIKKKEDEQRAR